MKEIFVFRDNFYYISPVLNKEDVDHFLFQKPHYSKFILGFWKIYKNNNDIIFYITSECSLMDKSAYNYYIYNASGCLLAYFRGVKLEDIYNNIKKKISFYKL